MTSEMLACQDENVAKVERVSAEVHQPIIVATTALTTQRNTIEFLRGKASDPDQRLTNINHHLGGTSQQLSQLG